MPAASEITATPSFAVAELAIKSPVTIAVATPVEPTYISSPEVKSLIVSVPKEKNVLLPAPPVKVFLPSPPFKLSSPAPPINASSPAPPVMSDPPAPAVKVDLIDEPMITS